MNCKKEKQKNKGITLIALVVTIVVLIILAGVSISMLTGQNGILNRAGEAKEQTDLGTIEEQANVEIATKMVEGTGTEYEIDASNIDLGEILSKVGANYEKVLVGGTPEKITLEKSNIIMNAKEETSIKVTYEGENLVFEDCVKVNGKYYKVNKDGYNIKIEREAKEIESSGNELTAEIASGNTVNLGKVTPTEIPVTATENGGTTKINITYGGKTVECNVSVVKKPAENAKPTVEDFNTDYGLVEVVWLDGTSNKIVEKPNAPKLSNQNVTGADALQPVTWSFTEGETEGTGTYTEDKVAKSEWYNYKAGTGTADNTSSQWANAKNGESYFVWIPRFAYRITYFEDKDYTKVTGVWDGNGCYSISGTLNYKNDEGIETTSDGNYIVHPAFGTNLDLGGWDGEGLTGFWMAKYEMSKTGASLTSSGSGTTFLSKPNVQSARSINIGSMYTYSYNYAREKESHLIKNSEWGAVALLTQSQYGRNGHEIDFNNNSNCVTGNGKGNTSSGQSSSVANAYNTEIGAHASTTGNIYGIYDMSGGAYEYVAAFDKLGNVSYVEGSSYGLNMTKNAKDSEGAYKSTKYITVYANGTSEYSSKSKLFEVSRIGDATKEVRQTNSGYGWHSDYSDFAGADYPFFFRGGFCSSSGPGVFDSGYNNGCGHVYRGFRVGLAL